MKKLFNKLRSGSQQEESEPSAATQPTFSDAMPTAQMARPPMPPVEAIKLKIGAARSVGMQRDHNEDAMFTLTTQLSANAATTPFGVYIVADGMGGHQFGEVASEVAIRTLAAHINQAVIQPLFGPAAQYPTNPLQEVLTQGVTDANVAVSDQAPGGGTTLTAVVILGDKMTVAHVGDSRAYAIDAEGRMRPLTRDHTLVKRLEEMGQITAEEAKLHPQKNVVYRALGQTDVFEPDLSTEPLPIPGHILVCSDGLWGQVSDEEMLQIIKGAQDPQTACKALIDAANASGGPDNITAVLVQITV